MDETFKTQLTSGACKSSKYYFCNFSVQLHFQTLQCLRKVQLLPCHPTSLPPSPQPLTFHLANMHLEGQLLLIGVAPTCSRLRHKFCKHKAICFNNASCCFNRFFIFFLYTLSRLVWELTHNAQQGGHETRGARSGKDKKCLWWMMMWVNPHCLPRYRTAAALGVRPSMCSDVSSSTRHLLCGGDVNRMDKTTFLE